MKNTILFLILFFLGVFWGNAQDTPIQHTVSKGETVFQLSRKYKVSIQEIYDLNPSAVEVIRIGEVLSIPKSQVPTQSSSTSTSTPTSTIITYAVVQGDTKYSLARNYGISVEELELQNPHTKNGLQAGHILKIETSQNEKKPTTNYTIKKTHLVQKGETLWGISRANDLTVEQLVNANSDILNGILQIGQLLDIPNPYNVSTSDATNTYLVQRGDTKYGLSKKYGVTIDELETTNPHIVKMLMAGSTINIPQEPSSTEPPSAYEPSKEQTEITATEPPSATDPIDETVTSTPTEDPPSVENPVANTPETPTSYVDYEVQAQETLYGLSKKAGISISDLVSLNPALANGVQYGMIIKMPSDVSHEALTPSAGESLVAKSNKRYADLSQSIQTVKKSEVLLFLPFSDTTFENNYNLNKNFNEVSDDFLRAHLEFYRGAKIAEDSARAIGLDFNLNIVETGTLSKHSNVMSVAEAQSASNYDALLMPFYETNGKDLARIVQDSNIPVVSAGSTQETGPKNLYNAVPSRNAMRQQMLDFILLKDANIIVVADMVKKEISNSIATYAPNAKFVEVTKKGTFNAENLTSLLDSDKLNYIILESEKNSVFLSTTNILLGQLSKFDIQLALLDTSLIPDTDDVSRKRFVILQMLFPSLSPLNESTFSAHFIASYKKTYGIEPSQNTKYGFDLTLDTLLRISQEKSFETSAASEITAYSLLKFDYRSNELGSHDNYGIYIIQYNPDGSLKEID